jgi:hypothetical protein
LPTRMPKVPRPLDQALTSLCVSAHRTIPLTVRRGLVPVRQLLNRRPIARPAPPLPRPG